MAADHGITLALLDGLEDRLKENERRNSRPTFIVAFPSHLCLYDTDLETDGFIRAALGFGVERIFGQDPDGGLWLYWESDQLRKDRAQ
jgi:hypothetical protein